MERNGQVVSEIFYSCRRKSELVINVQKRRQDSFCQCLWSRSRGRGAEIKLPPGAGAEITNAPAASATFYLSKALRNFIGKKSWLQILLG